MTTVIIISLVVSSLSFLSALIREASKHERRVDRLNERHARERAEERESRDEALSVLIANLSAAEIAAANERGALLDRIQHPEVLHFPSVQSNPSPPPKDPAELAHIGEQVPEFVNVGSTDEMVREEQELAKVGTVDNTDIGEVE